MTTEPDESSGEVRLVELIQPGKTNHFGTLFGGHALGLMDQAGFIAATRYAHQTMVTVAWSASSSRSRCAPASSSSCEPVS